MNNHPIRQLYMADAAYRYKKGRKSFFCPHFSLNPGEICIITGENGSGKSTFFRALTGGLKLTQGTYEIDGEDALTMSLGQLGTHIGLLYQEPSHQLFANTVMEELTFIPDLLGKDKEQTRNRAQQLLERFHIDSLKERSIFRLSRGEAQRTALCAVLMQQPDYLLLDEPTTGLDYDMRCILLEDLKNLAVHGMGIAVITHDSLVIDKLSQRMVTVKGGTVYEV